jgi:signal transduction histidine kinase/ligand-binding sensor domain-containing protein
VPRFVFRIFFFLALAGISAAAQSTADSEAPSEYTLRAWHVADGLPSDEIGSLAQDEKGYLWVATSGGLVRFDGTTFDPTPTPPEVSPRGLIYRRTLDHAGPDGLIALGNINGNTDGNVPGKPDGYYLNDNGTFRFQREPSLGDKVVRSAFVEEDGTLWLGCEDGTVFKRKGDATERFATPPGVSGRRIPNFATDGEKRVWVSIGPTIARYDGRHRVALPAQHGGTEIRIASSHTGGPWVLTPSAALKWDGEKLNEIVALPELLGAHFIQCAVEDRQGNLWIGTRSQGLYRIAPQQLLPVETSHEDIYSLFEDAEGDIWAGTNGGGLDRLRPKAYRLFDRDSGLSDNFSATVAEDAKGDIWLANRDGGVVRIQGERVDPISRRAGWRQFSAMSVYPSADGGMWITSGIGVYHTYPDSPDKIERLRSPNDLKLVRSTLVARNGDYWLSLDPDRIARWSNERVTIFDSAQGFDGREVRGLAEDAAGTIWVGAGEGKLFHTDGERFVPVPLAGAEKYGSLQVLRFEDDGTLLIGTTQAGVLILPPGERSQPHVLGSEQGLPNDNVTQILTDDFDRYWFASRGGIFCVNRQQVRDFAEGKIDRVHAVLLGKDDGLADLSALGLFQPSGWKARDGGLWFATRRGMLRISPSLIPSAASPPPVTLVGLRCDGHPQALASAVKIPASVRKTEIRFSALSLSTPGRIITRHRLDGFDNDWVLQTTGRVATYPRLPPGKYIFHVMASNGSGVWNDQGVDLAISVVPPWWNSVWAQLLYLLLLIAAIIAIVRIWSHRRLRGRLEKLQHESAIERERTRIARNIHDDLGASLTRISLLTQTAQHENPAQAASLEKIYDAADAITRSMDEIVWAVNPKCDDLESLVYYVGNFAQKFLGAAKIRCRLDMPAQPPAAALSSQIRHNLFLGCKEALNNVVKHARADEVTLTITADEQLLRVVIADNGRGFAAAKDAGASSGNAARVAPGNGLENMRERMEELGGRCLFSPRAEGGTAVIFSVPLPQRRR